MTEYSALYENGSIKLFDSNVINEIMTEYSARCEDGCTYAKVYEDEHSFTIKWKSPQGKIENRDYDYGDELWANQKARDNINETLYLCNADFIARHLNLPVSVIEFIQNSKDSDVILDSLINRLNERTNMIEDALLSDSRGHYISHYDCEENECIVDDMLIYYYRID